MNLAGAIATGQKLRPPQGPQLRATLFKQQLELLEDGSKRKTARCSRRAGKTYACVVRAAEVLLEGGTVLYVGLTRTDSKRIFWAPLQRLNYEHGLDFNFNEAELVARSSQGGMVIVTGADDEGELDKKRGLAYDLAILDEAGHYRINLEKFVEEVLAPALMDSDGELWMTGTPHPSCLGYFHDVDTDVKPGWAHFHWTLYDNPFMGDVVAKVDRECTTRGLDKSDPAYQREYLGEWVPGGGSLVYKFDPTQNIYETLPGSIEWHYSIGCDVGWIDSTAFTVLASARQHPTAYELFSAKRPGMYTDEIAGTLTQLMETYKDAVIVMDTGGGGKRVAEDINLRFRDIRSRIQPAEKKDKISTQGLLNSDLHNGKIKLLRGSPVIAEWLTIQQMPDGKEDPTVHNDLADAFLYAYRDCRTYMWRPQPIRDVSINSPTWGDRHERDKVEKMERAQKKAAQFANRGRRYG